MKNRENRFGFISFFLFLCIKKQHAENYDCVDDQVMVMGGVFRRSTEERCWVIWGITSHISLPRMYQPTFIKQ